MPIDIVEVAFKAGRIGIYANPQGLPIQPEDYVIVEADKGIDLGKITRRGQVFHETLLDENIKNVLRQATPFDLQQLWENRQREERAIRVCKNKIAKHQLNMNLVDAEYQLDRNKLTFYFTSDQRVDFRQLVRDLAARYKTRIELRQIGVRDAARHVGGYGTCGCQLCCTTFLHQFENISTQYIRDQMIQMNPSRLTGICGRLKCCLAFERDFYMEELAKYPRVDERVKTPQGEGVVQKIDIFNRVVYVLMPDQTIEKFSAAELQVAVPC